jgi:hypothetical protein
MTRRSHPTTVRPGNDATTPPDVEPLSQLGCDHRQRQRIGLQPHPHIRLESAHRLRGPVDLPLFRALNGDCRNDENTLTMLALAEYIQRESIMLRNSQMIDTHADRPSWAP